jgi:hypothetical protein
VFRDNLALHNSFGVHGAGRSTGNDTLQAFFPGAVFDNNVLAGGRASIYPAGNFFPSVSEFQDLFVSMAQDDYRLKPDSRYVRSASDGTALGAPIQQLLQRTPTPEGRRPPAVPKRGPGG